MKNILVIILVTSLAGCVSSAAPNFYNGRYYMAGDESCVQIRALSDTRVMCADTNGKETGYREAMTDQQLQMYQHNQQMDAQALDNFTKSMRRNRPKYTNCTTFSGGVDCTTY
ncbi:MAG: hypothetical protein Q8M57_00245 [Nitrosomonas sp.]|uniref:hypothetical protein n=1 Tax=Nitrosomonas sp. TaxID=42353 RepID=UPI0027347F73|nr:hypothetical protein [Nitrosomonas sp.]MDP3279483.1 hypothetical protein [Nitrosomonas sp.]